MIEWKNNGRTAIINGWWFHFDEMYALHGSDWSRDRYTLVQKYVDSHEIGRVNQREVGRHSPVGMRQRCGIYGYNYDENNRKVELWYAFFVPPEDHYNDMIQEAYQTYLLEKALKGSDSDHNTR